LTACRKLGCFRSGKTAFIETSSSKNIHLAVQGARLVAPGFERVQACKRFRFRGLESAADEETEILPRLRCAWEPILENNEERIRVPIAPLGQWTINKLGDVL
jgi:hypothetical protein